MMEVKVVFMMKVKEVSQLLYRDKEEIRDTEILRE